MSGPVYLQAISIVENSGPSTPLPDQYPPPRDPVPTQTPQGDGAAGSCPQSDANCHTVSFLDPLTARRPVHPEVPEGEAEQDRERLPRQA